jgi:hypothetical protein
MTSIADHVRSRGVELTFFLIVTGYAAWILSLPVFPSQDGPDHVYFAGVTAHLWSGSSAYRGAYEIVHHVSPYALQTYLLIPLLGWFGPVWAEKIFVCFVLILTASGMHFFSTRLGSSGDVVALLAAPFFLNGFLFLGFYNYCIALALGLVAAGIWSGANRTHAGHRVAFVVLALLIALAHPVSFGLLIAYCVAVLAMGALAGQVSGWHIEFPKPRPSDLIALLAAAAPMVYISRFVNSSEKAVQSSSFMLALRQGYDWRRLAIFAEMAFVSPATSVILRVTLAAVVLTTAVMAIRVAWEDLRGRRFRLAHLIVSLGLVLLLSLPLFPETVNEYGFLFPERLSLVAAWLLILGAAAVDFGNRRAMFARVGVLVAILTIAVLDHNIRPFAKLISVPKVAANRAGGNMYLVNGMPWKDPPGLYFDPCRAAGLRLIQSENGVWLNTPGWLNQSILMLRRTGKTDYDELLQHDDLTFVVVHCGESNAPLVAEVESRYRGKLTLTRGAFADILRPAPNPPPPVAAAR